VVNQASAGDRDGVEDQKFEPSQTLRIGFVVALVQRKILFFKASNAHSSGRGNDIIRTRFLTATR